MWGGNGGTCRCGAVWFQGLGSGGETCWAVFTWAGTGKEAAEACKRVKSREIDFGRVEWMAMVGGASVAGRWKQWVWKRCLHENCIDVERMVYDLEFKPDEIEA